MADSANDALHSALESVMSAAAVVGSVSSVERLTGGDVRLDLIEGGDHRLSTPADLDRLIAAVEAMRG